MEGIEILKTVEITKLQGWILPAFVISVTILVISSSFAMSSYKIIPVCISVIACIVTAIFFGFLLLSPRISTGKYKYDIRVSDNVPMNEFYEKYEILYKYEYSNVYTVKERIEE